MYGYLMVSRCHYDLVQAAKKDRFVLETPTSSVSQEALHRLEVFTREIDPLNRNNSQLVGLDFTIPVEHEDIINDLMEVEPKVVVYGNQHVWAVDKLWSGECTEEVTLDDEAWYDQRYEWSEVEKIGWR